QIFTKKGKSGKPEISFSTQFRDNSLRKKLAYNKYPMRFTNTNITDLSQVAVQRYDLQDQIFRNAIGSENNISVSGGNDNTQYYMSGSYLTNQGINRFDFKQQTSRLIGDFQLNITPIDNLSINYTLGYDNSTQLATGFIPINNTTPTYNTGYSRRADRLALLLNNDLNVAYKAQIGSWLQSSTGLGATAQTERISLSSITGTQLSPYSQVASAAATIVSTDARSTLNILGFYLQETLGFGNRLFLTGAIRNDVASSFGANNRWQYYPKLSASYLLSEESFWKNSSIASIVPTLKIRASYGQSGNLTAIGAYDRYSNYTSVSLAGLPGAIASSQQGNPNIKPERQTEREIGMDASFLKDRLGFEFSYYQKDVKDLLLFSNLRPTSGFSTQLQNIGNMTNKGLELLVRGIPVQTTNFRWNSTIIFSKNKNKVFDVPGGVLTFPGGFGQVAAVNGYS
ncbi:MAG: TonB-dependent receptor, partial [Sphingobacteriaceae bacterium]